MEPQGQKGQYQAIFHKCYHSLKTSKTERKEKNEEIIAKMFANLIKQTNPMI